MNDAAFTAAGAVVLLAGILAAPRVPAAGAAIERALASRWAPVVAGAVAFLFFLWAWGGSFNPPPIFHDETAYLLQARIFAHFRWASPAPPLPEFFDQFHVFVTPVLASKYPPGHSLLLVPGIWLGMPALMPLLLNAVSAALLYILVRKLAGGGAALLAVAVWTTSSGVHLHLSTYFSENTTVALWLAGWWLILRWREDRRPWQLCALAALVAWGGITRPLTMVVFAIPVGVVVLRDVVRGRRWRDLALAAAAGIVVCGIVPLWSWRTLGDWRVNPYPEYSRVYFPADRPGFGVDTTPPRRALAPDQAQFLQIARERRAAYTPDDMPRAYADRMRLLSRQFGFRWRKWLLVLAVVGLAVAPIPLWIAAGTGLLLTLAYLYFPHDPDWTLYYAEALPVVAALIALGGWRVLREYGRRTTPGVAAAPALLAAAAALALAIASVPHLAIARTIHTGRSRYFQTFERRIAAIPDAKAVVFIRYAPDHYLHWALIRSEPDPATARLWRVYDRGADNDRLLRAAPDRVPYLYDEATGQVYRLPR